MSFDRREALKRLALGGLGAAGVPRWVEALCTRAVDHSARHGAGQGLAAWTPVALNVHQNDTVTVVAELIIPETDTPGAKAANVNRFIDAVVADAAPAERETFLRGLDWLDTRSRERSGADFIAAAPDEQVALLTSLGAPERASTPSDQIGVEFFTAIKSMTITGYYTSGIGMKAELDDDGTRFFAGYAGCTHEEHQ